MNSPVKTFNFLYMLSTIILLLWPNLFFFFLLHSISKIETKARKLHCPNKTSDQGVRTSLVFYLHFLMMMKYFFNATAALLWGKGATVTLEAAFFFFCWGWVERTVCFWPVGSTLSWMWTVQAVVHTWLTPARDLIIFCLQHCIQLHKVNFFLFPWNTRIQLTPAAVNQNFSENIKLKLKIKSLLQ